MKELTYFKAAVEAISRALGDNDKIVVLGKGMTAGGKDGLFNEIFLKYGRSRVLDGTADDKSNIRIALGLAATGALPLVVVDGENLYSCIEAIAVDACCAQTAFNGQYSSSIVIWSDYGYADGDTPAEIFLSEGFFASLPNLTVYCPSCPEDACSMMATALRFPYNGPTLVLTDRSMRETSAKVTEEDAAPVRPQVGSQVIKEGGDVTLVSYGAMMQASMEAAYRASQAGCECELIDLRCLNPIDTAPVIASVKKTGKLAVAQAGWPRGGVGDILISAVMSSDAFDYMEKPVKIVSPPNKVIPYGDFAEKTVLPGWEEVYLAIISLI